MSVKNVIVVVALGASLSMPALSEDSIVKKWKQKLERSGVKHEQMDPDTQRFIEESLERSAEFRSEIEAKIEKRKSQQEAMEQQKPASGFAEEAGPMGFVIGKSTLSDVRSRFGEESIRVDKKPNKITGGQSLIIDSDEITVGATRFAYFVFDDDDQQTLTAVSMGLDTREYDRIKKHLESKYRMENEVDPHVGDESATFKTVNATDSSPATFIEISARHMSPSMKLEYKTSEFRLRQAGFNLKRQHKQSQKERDQL